MLKYRTHILLSLFSLAFGKSLAQSPSFQDAAVILILGAVFAFLEFKSSEKRIVEFEAVLNKQREDIDDLKEKVSSIKIVQQVKPNNIAFR